MNIRETARNYSKKVFYSVLAKSLKDAAKEQGLKKLIAELRRIVPDISAQYSTFKIDSGYLESKVRNMHAFQVLFINKVMGEFRDPVIVDIGDSAGTHLRYIIGIHSRNKNIKTLSVNTDPNAVRKIKEKGLNAINAKAEDLGRFEVDADIFLCFETLEHLTDPCRFLYQLSSKTGAKYLIITVPYLRQSRVGLQHIRQGRRETTNAERTHIYELSPGDWKLLARHSGWKVAEEKIYTQFPKKGFFSITRPLWQKFDFEGFYGLILEKDNTWSSMYSDW